MRVVFSKLYTFLMCLCAYFYFKVCLGDSKVNIKWPNIPISLCDLFFFLFFFFDYSLTFLYFNIGLYSTHHLIKYILSERKFNGDLHENINVLRRFYIWALFVFVSIYTIIFFQPFGGLNLKTCAACFYYKWRYCN